MTLDYEVYKEGGILNDRYQKVEDISEGSYGFVSLAKDTHKKKLVAVKHFFKIEDKDEGEEDRKENDKKNDDRKSLCYEAICEIDIQTKLGNEHRNIVKLLDHFDSYIVLEYCSGGDLYEAIKGGLVPRKTKKITYILQQMIDAIEFCHSKGVYHRDIKPENVLITNLFEWTIKLSDWGLATTDKTSIDRNVGSERYMAPELFESNLDIGERKEPYSCAKVDVWSLGIVFLNTVFSKNPFSVANQTDKAFCYFAANREALFDVFSTMSLDFFQVLRYSLTIDPTNRDLQKMRQELLNLSEYTLDDEYYNSLDDDLAVEEEPPSVAIPPSSAPAPAPVSLLTPASSAEHKKHIEKRRASDVKEITPISDERAKDVQRQDGRAKSVPKFKFQKKSHPSMGKTTEAKPIKYNQKNHYNFGRSNNNFYHTRRKPIKDSRKPLGIPTPNTHINNFFDDYRKARNNNNYHSNNYARSSNSYHNGSDWHSNGFNTRDFFTPPSVHNRYMEGIFSNGKKHGHYNNNNNRQRRSSFSQSSNNNVRNFLRATSPGRHSPGKYIPPNARNHHNWSLDSEPPNTNTYHEQFTKSGSDSSSGGGNGANDMDDVLFTLEENDNDFVNDLDSLSLHDSNQGKASTPTELQRPTSADMPTVQVTGENDDLPDLLKSPAPEPHQGLYPTTGGLNNFLKPLAGNGNEDSGHSDSDSNRNVNYETNNPIPQQTKPPRKSSESDSKYKAGVYIPPHHRRNSVSNPVANEATLSVTNNSLNYSTSFQARRQSGGNSYRHRPFIPPMNNNHSDFTTAVQDNDIFAQTSSDALLFEDDDVPTRTLPRFNANHPGERSMFGPYEIYDNGALPLGKARAGRKSSTFQEEAVGSLEQYKNNWLILQQQQD
ncbi:hypothetical protein ZYGR_0N04340 [Zygosaccharomyces rouxii]|uniref:non-specific serine/threonine protein kinase n=2 Tax=Zygosaccharomyces rouxii TaxID=4956 RepID=C5DVX8_ZYGRC|nr:uncharacterized protein ZYRO0D10252g [Zygosaccharomyces rouxii]GAV49029.1 hypothetical protein ZYGR_0N04340 [Zygosaccharomyces rouxii]CAR27947.1 ZYRO0D10252p [Zygosaccharomyces rouxii]